MSSLNSGGTEEAAAATKTTSCSQHANDGKAQYGGDGDGNDMGPPRDVLGYGKTAVSPHWPRHAKVALNFVLHYEEGGELCLLHGDDTTAVATPIAHNEGSQDTATPATTITTAPRRQQRARRNLRVESTDEYGARCGFWRLERLFTTKKIPITVWAVGMALERNMAVVGAMKQHQQDDQWEISSAGYRSGYDYNDTEDDDTNTTLEQEHLDRTIQIHKTLFGNGPVGLYQGETSAQTRRLAVAAGTFLYDSDAYNDDLPYWTTTTTTTTTRESNKKNHPKNNPTTKTTPHLIIPYTLEEQDQNFHTGEDFLQHLKRTLDYLILEGRAGQPKLMSVGVHCRLSRPARVAAVADFVDYAKSYGREVWITTREQIANHWYEKHLPRGCGTPILAGGQPPPGGSGSGGAALFPWASYGSGSGSGASTTPDGSGEGGDTAAAATPTASRFSFLGNLKAPRNSQEYKDSLHVKATKSDEVSDADDEDVI